MSNFKSLLPAYVTAFIAISTLITTCCNTREQLRLSKYQFEKDSILKSKQLEIAFIELSIHKDESYRKIINTGWEVINTVPFSKEIDKLPLIEKQKFLFKAIALLNSELENSVLKADTICFDKWMEAINAFTLATDALGNRQRIDPHVQNGLKALFYIPNHLKKI